MRYLRPMALAIILVGCTTSSYSWQRYTEKDLPAEVNFVLTPFGDVIDAHQVLRYGRWTVGFAEGKPQASFVCPPDTTCYIAVNNLKCVHQSGDTAVCRLNLFDDGSCNLVIPKRNERFQIECPVEVSLGPRNARDKAQPKKALPKT